jgi:hypothetical protein
MSALEILPILSKSSENICNLKTNDVNMHMGNCTLTIVNLIKHCLVFVSSGKEKRLSLTSEHVSYK